MKGTIYVHSAAGQIIGHEQFDGSRKQLKARLTELASKRPHFERDRAELVTIANFQELRQHQERMLKGPQ